jgi:aminoglycoside phosphotransferase (APT) family kinase protein
MTTRRQPRPGWAELPDALRAHVADLLGAAVVEGDSRAGGWSPGSADVVRLADGRRAFVKAADARVNAVTVALHRREAAMLRLLADGTAPRLIGVVDDPPWIALVVEHVEGRHPDPASEADTLVVLDAVAALPAAPPGAPLNTAEQELAFVSLGWERLDAEGAPLPPDVAAALPGLAALSAGSLPALHGDAVVHGDLRPDNVLVEPHGRARLIDWPSAFAGARWFDAVTYLLDVRHLGGRVAAGLQHPVLRDVPSEAVDGLLALLGAYFFDRGRAPEEPGLPGIRAYQLAQGRTVVDWLLERRPDLR